METESLRWAALQPPLLVRFDDFTASERSSAAPGSLNYHTNLNPAEESLILFSNAGPNYWPAMINLLSVTNVTPGRGPRLQTTLSAISSPPTPTPLQRHAIAATA